MNAAWSIVLGHECFWGHLSKDHLGLVASTCSSFRADISQRVAIFALFRGRKPVKKAVLFRLLPLRARDLGVLRSPVDFLAAFSIAEREVGGFDRCLAAVREKGWCCWLESAVRLGLRKRRRCLDMVGEYSFTVAVQCTGGDGPRVILRRFFDRFLSWSDGDYVSKANRDRKRNIYYVIPCLSDHQSLARIESGERYRFLIKSAEIPVQEMEAVVELVRFMSDGCNRALWLSEPTDFIRRGKLMEELSRVRDFGQSRIYRNRVSCCDTVNLMCAMSLAAECLTIP